MTIDNKMISAITLRHDPIIYKPHVTTAYFFQ